MFEIILISTLIIYTFSLVIFLISSNKNFTQDTIENLKSVSVIVAIRNEVRNIEQCFKSLTELEYPAQNLEIIFVDDFSTDETFSKTGSLIKVDNRFRLISANKPRGNLKGKANAIDTAINSATGEIILTTDADCTVNKNWVREMVSYFNEDVGVVCGYTNQSSSNHFEQMQSIDFLFLLRVAAGSMNLKRPVSCMGNNMAFLKSAYYDVGGFANQKFSVTEDLNLLVAINKLKKYKIIYPFNKNALVTSNPKSNIVSLFQQKRRWAIGGLGAPIEGFLILLIAFVFYSLIIYGSIVQGFFTLISILGMLIIDFVFIKSLAAKLNLPVKFIDFLIFELYKISYTLIIPITTVYPKITWKGRKL